MDDALTALLKEWREVILAAADASRKPGYRIGDVRYRSGNEVYATAIAASLLGAIEAVLTYHRKMTVCEISIHAHDNSEPPRVYCGHSYAETENSRHVMDDDDNIICLDKPVADVCESCRDESGEAEDWPCSEYRAITRALSGNPGAQEAQRGGAEDG